MSVLLSQRRRTTRGEINPMDKATIVSIFPKYIKEIKPTIQPGVFELKKGSYEAPSVLVVGPSSWWLEVNEETPLVEIPNSAVQVADAIVRDYCNAVMCYVSEIASPGIFYVPGEFSLVKIKTDYKALLDAAAARQRAWYTELVKQADILWSRTNGNPIAIAEDMKLAAQELSIKDKPWMHDFNTLQMVNCAACGSLRNPLFPICPSCHSIVDRELYKKLGLDSAEKK